MVQSGSSLAQQSKAVSPADLHRRFHPTHAEYRSRGRQCLKEPRFTSAVDRIQDTPQTIGGSATDIVDRPSYGRDLVE